MFNAYIKDRDEGYKFWILFIFNI